MRRRRQRPGLDRRDATRKTVCRGALGARQAAQGRVGGIGPRHVATLLVYIRFFRRTRPLSRTRSVHTRPAAPGPGLAGSTAPLPTSRTRPSQRNVPRPLPGRMTPSWSSPRASSRRPAAGNPEGKESLRYDPRYPVARPPDRHESFIRWRSIRRGLARLPRRLVRPLPEDAPGRQPVRRRDIRSSRSTSTEPRRSADRYGVNAVPTSSSSIARAASSTAPAASSPPPCWSDSTSPPGPRPSRPPNPTRMPSPATTRGPTPATTRNRRPAPCDGRNGWTRGRRGRPRRRGDRAIHRRSARRRPSPIPIRPRPWCGSRYWATLDRLRLGHDHLQLARGVGHPDLRAHLQAGGRARQVPPSQFPWQIVIDLFDGRRNSGASGAAKGQLRRVVPGPGDRLRLHPGRRADRHPAGPAAAGQPGRAAALAAQEHPKPM